MKCGDVVRLRSGGSLMTVESVVDADVNCAWFEPLAGGEWSDLNREQFALAALEIVVTA